ncbi:MAG TPA: HAMP domain-containing sensor histidine kinase [Thermomicrobiales bacterium]|jgi:signal transduction histidine kinase|nr:HAMP domain-containing sensor histidine kinase [Thermomicrobiales bacterium]
MGSTSDMTSVSNRVRGVPPRRIEPDLRLADLRPATPYRALVVRIGAVIIATAAVAVLAALWLGARDRDLQQLVAFMLISGGGSLALGWGAGWSAGRRHVTLRVALALVSALGPVIALANVAFTARLMFISPHDLVLLTLLIGFALTPGIAVASLFGSRIAATIASLSDGAARMARGDLSTRVRGEGIAELGALAASFNSMAAQLEEAASARAEIERTRRDLIAAVSHDLRTPLASLRALAEALNDGIVDDPAHMRRYLTLIAGETERLNALIDDLFELARLEAGAVHLDCAPISAPALLNETVARMMPQAERKGVTLTADVPDNLPLILADAPQLSRVLLNLVQNAIRHTPPGGRVQLRACRQDGALLLTVEDTGEGIAPADLPRVFDRFYRGDPARSREAGSGLGLAIARGLVEAHGGHIWVESTPGQGACFAFTIPLAPSTATCPTPHRGV